MYTAKRTGKDRVASPRIEELARSTRAARLLPELHDAIGDGQLVMYGQPVVDVATGVTIAVETLIRWRHPVRGILPPSEFLDVVEHSPLMIPLGQRACRMAAAWSEQFGAVAPHVHVNVSGRQLESGHLTSDILAALTAYSLPANRLVLELTETHMPNITNSLLADLNDLRDRGVRIAIDDVGTGHSSLTRITELPVDILKIDLRFIAGLGTDPACDAVVRAVLSLGQAMGLSVIAEGVETPHQLELLRTYGCDTAQGYLYSPPRPETELLQYFGAHTGARDLRCEHPRIWQFGTPRGPGFDLKVERRDRVIEGGVPDTDAFDMPDEAQDADPVGASLKEPLSYEEDNELRRLNFFNRFADLSPRSWGRLAELRLRDRRREIREPREFADDYGQPYNAKWRVDLPDR